MIYILKNDDGGTYFIDTALPFDEISDILSEHDLLMGKVDRIEWTSSVQISLSDAIRVSDFFESHWEPMKPGVELYEGGGPKHQKDRDEREMELWKASKYRHPYWPPNRMHGTDPVKEKFNKLTSSVAKEIFHGWKKHLLENEWAGKESMVWSVDCFEMECKELGLL